MIMTPDMRNYLLSLNVSKLSDQEIEQIFDLIAMLDDHQSAQPRTFAGKRATVKTFLGLLQHAPTLPDFLPRPIR